MFEVKCERAAILNGKESGVGCRDDKRPSERAETSQELHGDGVLAMRGEMCFVLLLAVFVLAACAKAAGVKSLQPDLGYENSQAVVDSLHPTLNGRSCPTRNATASSSVRASIPTRSR